jgi:hypothetical protein
MQQKPDSVGQFDQPEQKKLDKAALETGKTVNKNKPHMQKPLKDYQNHQ